MTEQQPHAVAPMSSSPAQVDHELRGKSILQGIDVCGDIATDTTWTIADSPVVVTCYVTVKTGATLTVEPGVAVKFEYPTRLTVEQNATLRAEGTAESPIYFTSIKDDSAGGDTNGDEGATLPAKGDWYYIKVESSSTSSSFHGTLIFDHVVVRYGGIASPGYMLDIGGDAQIRNSVIEESDYSGIRIYKGPTSNPTVIIENTTLRNNDSKGVYLAGVSPTITGNTFSSNGGAIWADSSAASISDNTISGSGILLYDSSPTVSGNTLSRDAGSYSGTGIESHNSTPELINNTISDYEYPVKVFDGYPQVAPTYTGNNFTDNRYSNVIGVGGNLTTGSWTSQGGYTHVIGSYITLPSGVELTVPAGTVIKFEYPTRLTVGQNATLRAEGTAESPIYFTSIKDDSAGGDTNGDEGATLPAKGDWYYIKVESSSTSSSFHGTLIFDHVVVRYGGIASPGYMLDIGGDAQIRNSVIEESDYSGIRIYKGPTSNPTVIIENTTLRNNDSRAIYVEGP